MTKPVGPSTEDLLAHLAAARDEVAQAAAKSRAMKRQMLAEGLCQAAQVARAAGDGARAQALVEEADRMDPAKLDLKA